MAFYDPNINAFVPYQKDGAKIIKINETTGEQYEIDNPDYTPLKEYTHEEIDGFFERVSQGYKMQPADDGKVQMIPPDPVETQKAEAIKRIAALKSYLSATDYQAIKFAEGELSAEDYADMKTQRAEWRAEINQLEEKLNSLGENNNE